jgi:hypothetical protein
MKTLQFDQRGLLMPYDRIALSMEEFEAFFVNGFSDNSKRKELFSSYKAYIAAFQYEITPRFVQWIDGSFLTKKTSPRDLDFVTLLDFGIANEKSELLRSKFLFKASEQFFGLDAYLVEVFPESHRNHFITKSDLAYWNSWFSRTSENRAGKSHNKGFVEINFSK